MHGSSCKYTLFYSVDDGELYAYTDNRKFACKFRNTRKKNIFVEKRRKLTSKELRFLNEEYPGGLLKETHYKIGDLDFPIITTTMEYVTVLNWGVQVVEQELPLITMTISPKIFEDWVIDALDKIGYLALWRYITNQTSTSLPISPNYFMCFVHLYGKTLRWDWR